MQKIVNDIFLESAKARLGYYKALAEKAMDQLTEEQLFILPNAASNSIAMIVQHMAGNMTSRWTDFLTTDGEKQWRKREEEFEVVLKTRAALLTCWEQGWNCFFEALSDLRPNQLLDIIYIRSEAHTVMDAINRQLAHYPYHVGQIVFYAKILKQGQWVTLSIPKRP